MYPPKKFTDIYFKEFNSYLSWGPLFVVRLRYELFEYNYNLNLLLSCIMYINRINHYLSII